MILGYSSGGLSAGDTTVVASESLGQDPRLTRMPPPLLPPWMEIAPERKMCEECSLQRYYAVIKGTFVTGSFIGPGALYV